MSVIDEADDVYAALVAELPETIVPTSIMGITLVGIGLFVAATLSDVGVLCCVLAGGLASLAKIGLMIAQTRRNAGAPLARSESRLWELGHGVTTVIVAASIGILATIVLAGPDMAMKMLAIALLFGYCAGVVSRLSIRPCLAVAALLLAGLPAIAATAMMGDANHAILSAMFGLFLAGSFNGVVFAYRTAVRRIVLHRDMANLARRDPLTGLANRRGLYEAFQTLGPSEGTRLAVHCFDLDGFKPINDRFGHQAGDALLQALGGRLSRLLADQGLAARIGGDEFVVLQPEIRHRRDAEHLARRIHGAVSEPYELGAEVVRVGVSLGFACGTPGGTDLDDLMREADAASYRIKRQGGGVAASEADLSLSLPA